MTDIMQPHDLAVEKAILQAVYEDPQQIKSVAQRVKSYRWFYAEENQYQFRAMIRLNDIDISPTRDMVARELSKHDHRFEAILGDSHIDPSSIADDKRVSVMVQYLEVDALDTGELVKGGIDPLLHILADNFDRRERVNIANINIADALDTRLNRLERHQRANQRQSGLHTGKQNRKTGQETHTDFVDFLDDDSVITGWDTGSRYLNAMLDIAYAEGTFTTIAGYTNNYKSFLLNQFAIAAFTQGIPVLFNTLESNIDTVHKRMVAQLSGVPLTMIQRRDFGGCAEERARAIEASYLIKDSPIEFVQIDDIANIEAELDQLSVRYWREGLWR